MTPRVGAAILAALLLGGCSAGQGEGEDAAMEIEVGEAFEWNGFEAREGWSLAAEEVERGGQTFQQPDIVDLKVTNTGTSTRFALFRIEFGRGSRLAAGINCSSESEIRPGETDALACPGLGAVYPAEYDSVMIGKIER